VPGLRFLATTWGVGGVLLCLVYAIWRLFPTAIAAFDHELNFFHWLLLIGNTAMMAYYEGYKGFQLAFSPRIAARARYLFYHGSLQATWVLTVCIIALALIFQRLPQPIRGILDVGVVLGLSWGILATAICCLQAFLNTNYYHDPELSASCKASQPQKAQH